MTIGELAAEQDSEWGRIKGKYCKYLYLILTRDIVNKFASRSTLHRKKSPEPIWWERISPRSKAITPTILLAFFTRPCGLHISSRGYVVLITDKIGSEPL
jgi:hypothetical protein